MRNINLPNTLSAARLLLVPVAVWLLLSGRPAAAALCVAFCGLLDILDGEAARRLRQETPLGKLLDPLADKLLCAAVFIALSLMGRIPFWFTGCVLARDAAISLAALAIYRRRGIQTTSVAAGKTAFFALTATAVLSMTFADYLAPALALSCLAMAYSLAGYARAYIALLSPNRGGVEAA